MKDFVDYQKKSDDTVSRLSEEIAKARTDLEMAYLKKVTDRRSFGLAVRKFCFRSHEF